MVSRNLLRNHPHLFALVAIGLTAVAERAALRAAEDKPGAGVRPAAPPRPAREPAAPARAAARYDGKSFAEWEVALRTELKAERRVEALQAMAAFGLNGYAREAAAAVLDLAQRPDLDADDEADRPVLQKAVWALRRIGDPCVPVLLDALQAPNPMRRKVAAGVLAGSERLRPSRYRR